MKKGLLVCFISALLMHTSVFAAQYYSCKGKYALCTTALCKPMAGKRGMLSCKCGVKTGYSVGAKTCVPVKKTQEGTVVYSRYYPITSYVKCSNNRPWAWCLDSPCVIDKKHPSVAHCACSAVTSKEPYVIVSNKNTPSTCHKGIYSSATIDDVEDVNNFLKTQTEPKLRPIKVYEGK